MADDKKPFNPIVNLGECGEFSCDREGCKERYREEGRNEVRENEIPVAEDRAYQKGVKNTVITAAMMYIGSKAVSFAYDKYTQSNLKPKVDATIDSVKTSAKNKYDTVKLKISNFTHMKSK